MAETDPPAADVKTPWTPIEKLSLAVLVISIVVGFCMTIFAPV